MSLGGNLRTMSLPDVLQWIALGQKTGSLLVRRGATETRIMFRDGSLFSSWSNDPRHSLGQYLIRDRQVSEEQLFKALLQGSAFRVQCQERRQIKLNAPSADSRQHLIRMFTNEL